MAKLKDDLGLCVSLRDERIGNARRDDTRDFEQVAQDEVVPWSDDLKALPPRALRMLHSQFAVKAIIEEAQALVARVPDAQAIGLGLKANQLNRLSDCAHLLDTTLWRAYALAKLSTAADCSLPQLERIQLLETQQVYIGDGRIIERSQASPEQIEKAVSRLQVTQEIALQKELANKAFHSALEVLDAFDQAKERELVQVDSSASGTSRTPQAPEFHFHSPRTWFRRFRTSTVVEPDRPRESFGTKWNGAKSYEELLEDSINSASKKRTVEFQDQSIEVFGATKTQLRTLRRVLSHNSSSAWLKDKLKEVRVVPRIGTLEGKGGAETNAIYSFSINQDGIALMSSEAFKDLASLTQVMNELAFFEADRLGDDYQNRDRTMLAQRRLAEESLFVPAENETEHGHMKAFGKEYPILGRDSRISGTVYVGGAQRASLIIGPTPLMRRLADDFWVDELKVLPCDPFDTARRLYQYISQVLPYDRAVEERLRKFHCDYQFTSVNTPAFFDVLFELPAPDFDRMIDMLNSRQVHVQRQAGGVCSHQAALACFILERGIDFGFIDGTVSFERNSTQHGAHAYALWEPRPDKPVIIDPAQNYGGSIRGGMWPYLRKSHVELLRKHPVPLGRGEQW